MVEIDFAFKIPYFLIGFIYVGYLTIKEEKIELKKLEKVWLGYILTIDELKPLIESNTNNSYETKHIINKNIGVNNIIKFDEDNKLIKYDIIGNNNKMIGYELADMYLMEDFTKKCETLFFNDY